MYKRLAPIFLKLLNYSDSHSVHCRGSCRSARCQRWVPTSVRILVANGVGFLVGFLIGLGMVFGRFLEGFWDPGASKVSVWCRRGAILQKFTYFSQVSFWDRFLDDFD